MSEQIMFKRPTGLDSVVRALSQFDEQLGFLVKDKTITTNKVGATYKITANIKLSDDILEVPEEGFNLGIISLPRFQKMLGLFSNETVLYVRKSELGLLKLYLVEDKKVSSLPISDLIKPDDSSINKNRENLFSIEFNNDLVNFIKQASKISNVMIIQLAFQKKENGKYDAFFIIGDIKDSSEYLSSHIVVEDIDDIEVLKDSPISKLFFEHGDYDLVIRYNLIDVLKSLNAENLKLTMLTSGALVISEQGDDYEIDYGFIPIQ